MAQAIPTFEEYVSTLGSMTPHVDPTEESTEGRAFKLAAAELAALPEVTIESLTEWLPTNPVAIPALGLVVGLTQEKLKNQATHGLGTSGFMTLAKNRALETVQFLDDNFNLVESLQAQVHRAYTFGDVLAARAGTRAYAVRAGRAGRKLEDEIQAIAEGLGLPHALRGKFEGRNGRTAPFDLAVPAAGPEALVVVAAKVFDSTGSKLTDAVREIEEMAAVRRPAQFVYAVIDGIGWKSRISDLHRIYDLWATHEIDGMYTLASLPQFQIDLAQAARVHSLIYEAPEHS